MNTCIAKTQDGMAESILLFDVLPTSANDSAGVWLRHEQPLDEALTTALTQRPIDPSIALCAALALVESHLTGADSIVASRCVAQGFAATFDRGTAIGSR